MSMINSLKQYIILTRLNQPIGFLLLMLPCIWGVLAACNNMNDLNDNLFLIVLFIFGSVIMRSAGCIINDLIDINLDKKIERTSQRPLTSGQISILESLIFLFILLILAFYILLQFNINTILIGMFALPLVILYPFLKRFTYWPQLGLGITFSWGVLVVSIEFNISNIF